MREAPQLLGEASAWLAALEHVSMVATLERPMLVIGERGTGKELIGERLHFLSRRWDQPFVKVNCAALSEDLLDSELFGHEAGAFTGATKRRVGRFEQADGGTLFLDEIATASLKVQEKLLRVVEYGEFQRLGGETVLECDVRVVAATNVHLPGQVEAGRFRADLLDRLAWDVITLPPLRARRGDASLMADFFAARLAREMGLDFPGFSPEAVAQIDAGAWPGNVRELKNVAERAAHRSLSRDSAAPVDLTPDDLDPFASPFAPTARPSAQQTPDLAPPELPRPRLGVDFEAQVAAFEIALIETALDRHDRHQGKAADALGLSYHQFRGLLKKHGYGRKASPPSRAENLQEETQS
jgi:psp operon transcriptional activator